MTPETKLLITTLDWVATALGGSAKPFHCGDCGQPCDAVEHDDSFDYEYGSIAAIETIICYASDCCDGTLYYDAALTVEVSDLDDILNNF